VSSNPVEGRTQICQLKDLILTLFVTRLKWMVPLVEQELLTLPEYLSSPPVFSGVRVTRSLVLYVCFVDRCLSFCTFSFGHCVVSSSSIYGFWLPLWFRCVFRRWPSLLLVSSNYMLDLNSHIEKSSTCLTIYTYTCEN
jgi:hypothetical protein